ncbi:Uncharacterized protein TCM_030345 [Theobroma cacao]|uniref:Uncharacterized protein n=1 Tax=Theobroma cacao TaxID=3641 RepID=A0A061GG69_THECC|nr:Uncharacterized protein TCM_030345 [Theobroma cacao]
MDKDQFKCLGAQAHAKEASDSIDNNYGLVNLRHENRFNQKSSYQDIIIGSLNLVILNPVLEAKIWVFHCSSKTCNTGKFMSTIPRI